MFTCFIRNKIMSAAMLSFIALTMSGCRDSGPKNSSTVALKTSGETVRGADDMQLVCRGQAEPVRSFKYRLNSGQKIFRYLVREGDQVLSGQRLFESGSVDLMAQSDEVNRMKIAIWDRRKRLRDLVWQSAELERALAASRMKKSQVDGSELQDPDIARMVTAKKMELDALQEEKMLLSAIAGADRLLGQALEKLDERIKEEISSLRFCSPFAGRVIYIPENVEQLLPGEMALEIWDESQIIVQIKAWQNQLRFIARGQVVEVQPDLFDGVLLQGTVLSIGSSPEQRANNGNPEYLVKISLQDGRAMIRPGMTVSVKIDLDKAKEPVSLP